VPSKKTGIVAQVGRNIARARKAGGFSQAALAEEIGIDPRSLQRIESGLAAPSLSRLEQIAEELGVSVADLVEGREPDTTKEAKASEVHRVWKRVPAGRRKLALAVLKTFAKTRS